MIDGAKLGVLVLLAVTLAVQGGFVGFFLYLRKRAKHIAELDLEAEWSELQEGVENIMTEWLGLPPLAAAHGGQIDSLIGWIHIFMLVLFVGWGGFFAYCLVRFRRSRQSGGRLHGGHVARVELSRRSAWPSSRRSCCSDSRSRSGPRGSTTVPPESEALVVQVTGEQFAWNIHYAGPDGRFGRTDITMIDLQSNPLGLDRSDPAAKDDVTTVNQLYPAGEQADHREAEEQGCHPQLRRAGVPREAGRRARPHDPDLVRPQRHDRRDADPNRESRIPVRDRLRAALRSGPRPDAGICHRPERRRVPEVDRRKGQGGGVGRRQSVQVVRPGELSTANFQLPTANSQRPTHKLSFRVESWNWELEVGRLGVDAD